MNVIEWLNAEIKVQDRRVLDSVAKGHYNADAAQLRALLELVVEHIRNAEQSAWDAYHVGVADGKRGFGVMRQH